MSDPAAARQARAPRRRLPAAERRSQILSVAKTLFLAEGVERTSMRAIAARVGITPAAIYQHFPDKDTILFEIGQDFFGGLLALQDQAVAGVADPLDRLRARIDAYLRYGFDHSVEYQLMFMTPTSRLGEAPDGTAHAETVKGMAAFNRLRDQISALSEAGLLKPGDPTTLAQLAWAACHGLVALLITHKKFAFSDPVVLGRCLVDTILHGLCVAGPGRPERS